MNAGVIVQCGLRAISAYLRSRSLMAWRWMPPCGEDPAMKPSTSSSGAVESHSRISPSLQFRISLSVLAMRAGYAPNDPKLSDRRGWRDRCVVGGKAAAEAAGVTAAPVRCSAWLGVFI